MKPFGFLGTETVQAKRLILHHAKMLKNSQKHSLSSSENLGSKLDHQFLKNITSWTGVEINMLHHIIGYFVMQDNVKDGQL